MPASPTYERVEDDSLKYVYASPFSEDVNLVKEIEDHSGISVTYE